MKKLSFIFLVFVFSHSYCQDLQIENDLRDEEFWDDKIKSSGIRSLEIRAYSPDENLDNKGTPYRLYIYNSSGKKEKSYYFNPDSSIKYQMTYIYDKENILHKIKVIYKDTVIKISNIKLNDKGMLSSFKIAHPLDGYSSVKYDYTKEGSMNKVHLKLFSHYVNYNGKYRSRRMYGYVPDRDAGTKVEAIEVEYIYLKEGAESSSGSLPFSDHKESQICYSDHSGNIIEQRNFINGTALDKHTMEYNHQGFITQQAYSVNNIVLKKYKFNYKN